MSKMGIEQYSMKTRHLFSIESSKATYMIKFTSNGLSKGWYISTEATSISRMLSKLVPLQDDVFCFDQVWRLKAIFFYHILSNFKNIRDYGSSSLANLIIEESKKSKVTNQVLFRRLKNKYGLKNFRTIYEHQFVQSTGLNRIFYEIIDLKKQSRVKILVRQKALANKVFRMYNFYRIKLEQ